MEVRHQLAAPAISLVEVYPDLHDKVRKGCYHSLQFLLAAVWSDQNTFQWLLNEITYQVLPVFRFLIMICNFVVIILISKGLLRCSTHSEVLDYSSLWSDLVTKYTPRITDTEVKRDLHQSLLDSFINRLA